MVSSHALSRYFCLNKCEDSHLTINIGVKQHVEGFTIKNAMKTERWCDDYGEIHWSDSGWEGYQPWILRIPIWLDELMKAEGYCNAVLCKSSWIVLMDISHNRLVLSSRTASWVRLYVRAKPFQASLHKCLSHSHDGVKSCGSFLGLWRIDDILCRLEMIYPNSSHEHNIFWLVLWNMFIFP